MNRIVGFWTFREHGARKGEETQVNVRVGQNAEAALAKAFPHHERFRKEGTRDRRKLSEFLPEVTPGVLTWTAGSTAKGKVKVSAKAINALAVWTLNAYSVKAYANWRDVAALLLRRGYTAAEAEAIMRSKWTRWASDASNVEYGKVPASAVADYLDTMTDNRRAREVAALVKGDK